MRHKCSVLFFYENNAAISVSCPTLRSPNHGRLSTTDTDPGVSVRVVCDDGYTFDETTGDPSTVCRLTGSWSSTLGGCKEGQV